MLVDDADLEQSFSRSGPPQRLEDADARTDSQRQDGAEKTEHGGRVSRKGNRDN